MVIDSEAPKDRFKLVYLIFILHGVGVLTPWNMFITAKPYFMEFKLHSNYTGSASPYNKYLMNYLCFAHDIPNAIFQWLNVFIKFKCKVDTKVFGCLSYEMLIMLLTIILAMVCSKNWPGTFFWITMVTGASMFSASAVYQNTLYGLVPKLPPRYVACIMLGKDICGIIVTCISIITNLTLPNKRTAAIYYFVAGLYILMSCLVTYFSLTVNKFYRFYDLKFRKLVHQNALTQEKIPFWYIFKRAFPQLLNILVMDFGSCLIYPAIYAQVVKSDPNFFVPKHLFTNITCFLTFNLFSMIGNLFSLVFWWPKPKYICIPVFLRLILIPLFLICNYRPPDTIRTMPVWINNEWAYWCLGVILGLTSGYFSAVVMVYITQTVEDVHKSVAGKLGAASMLTGVFCADMLSFLCPTIVSKIY